MRHRRRTRGKEVTSGEQRRRLLTHKLSLCRDLNGSKEPWSE